MVYELIYLIKFIKFFEPFLLTEALLQFAHGAAYVLEDADKFVRQGIQPRGLRMIILWESLSATCLTRVFITVTDWL